MRVADIIAEILIKNQITNIFTVTGGGAMHLNDAFGKNKALKCIYQHHEQACAMAAEGFSRISGKPACVCVTTGPGGINALTGVFGAYTDSIPMVIISGQVRSDTTVGSSKLKLRQLGDQEFDIISVAKKMTKYSVLVYDANEIVYHLEKAIYIAQNGRKGPVWIDVPVNIQAEIININSLKSFDEKEMKDMVLPPVSQETINDVVQKLSSAKRPLIFAGQGIRKADAYDEFLKLIDKANIPVATAWNAHDLILSDNHLNAGKPSTVGDRAGNLAVQNCDVLLILGSRLNIRQISYNYQKWSKFSYKIYVDIDENELNKPTLNIDKKIQADLKDFIEKLEKKVIPIKTSCWHNYIIENRKRFSVILKEYSKINRPLNPYCFMDKIFTNLPEQQVTVMANGSACVMGLQASVTKKGSRYFTNDGCASMGYGLPAAIGASIAAKGNQIVCIEGDGSLQMNIQELQTVKTNKLKIKTFVINNKGYHSIRQTQSNFFGGPLVGVEEKELGFPSLKSIAKAYCLKYVKIDKLKDCDRKIKKVLKAKDAVLCEVKVDETQIFSPKLSSKKLSNGKMESPGLEDMYPFLSKEELRSLMFMPFEEE